MEAVKYFEMQRALTHEREGAQRFAIFVSDVPLQTEKKLSIKRSSKHATLDYRFYSLYFLRSGLS